MTFSRSKSPKPRILFVEDEAAIRNHVAKSLSDEFDVETAADGEQALHAVLRARPDLVATDLMMPGLDGLELVKTLRATPSIASIPILMISGRAPEEIRLSGFELGADSYLAKPYQERELRVRLRAMLESVRRRDLETSEAERRLAEQLAIVERSALLESITDAFYSLDHQWRFAYVNQRALDYYRKTREELIGKVVWDVFPMVRGSAFQTEYERAVREQTSVEFEVLSAFSGRWVEVHAYPGPQGLAVNFRDITDRKHVEAALRDSELRFRSMADAVPTLIWRADPQNQGVWFSKQWLQYTGRSLDEELGIGWTQSIHPDDGERVLHTYSEALSHRTPFETEFRLRRHDGEYRYMLDRGAPVFDGPDGAFSGYIGTCIDITDRKDAEEELRRSEERYRAFISNSSEGIWRYELDEPLDLDMTLEQQVSHIHEHARLAELNDAMAQMYGYEHSHELAGAPLTQMLPLDDVAARSYLTQLVKAGFSLNGVESIERDKHGNVRYFENSIVPVLEGGKLVRAWGSQRDITARKSAEQMLKDSERRKDEFLAVLAHELRNPLAPIRNGLQILRMRGAHDGLTDRTLTMMDRQMTHMVRLVDDLLDLGRISRGKLELRRQALRLVEVLARAAEASSSLIEARRHQLNIDTQDPNIWVNGDPNRLAQIFSNLLSNSAKYTDEGGKITLALRREGQNAVVSVTDTGIGIPSEQLESVFDMFSQVGSHQSRAEGGLGIGLALVQTLVEMHGGTVEALSAGPGRGSTFVVRLPSVASDSTAASASGGAARGATQQRRVLVVDDNHDAAESLAMLLEVRGHVVRTANGGVEAIALAKEFGPELVFMDIGMPQMSGTEATRRIRTLPRGRDILIVALTGWGQQRDRERTREAGVDLHFIKPISEEALDKALLMLDERGSEKSARR